MNKVKLNKYKHKKTKWTTYGIIRSIKFRDHLYRRLKQVHQNTPEYFNLKVNLSTYNTILKKLIREAKSNFYQAKFEQCQSDSKQTWETIKVVIHRFDKHPGGDACFSH